MGQQINMQNYMGVSYSNECKFVAKCITNTVSSLCVLTTFLDGHPAKCGKLEK